MSRTHAAFFSQSLLLLAGLAVGACGSDSKIAGPGAGGAGGGGGTPGTSGIGGSGHGGSGPGGSGPGGGGSGGSAGMGTMSAGGNGGSDSVDASSGSGGSTAVDSGSEDATVIRPDTGVVDPGTMGDGDFTIGPNPPAHPDVAQRNVPHGRSFTFVMSSTTSAIFTGLATTLLPQNQHSFTRSVVVYIPNQYVDGTAAPFMVVQDARDQGDIRNTVDNLVAANRLPKLIVLFVNNGGGDSKGSERGLEYDTMSDAYSRFVDTEVLPAVLADSAIKMAYPNLKLTDNPDGRSTYGCSSGGSAALIQGWFTPDKYRRLVTYSGTFVDQQDDDAPTEQQYPLGAWEFHSGLALIANNPVKPLRVYLEVGENDNGSTDPESGHHNWVMANQRTAAALKAKGYHYRFVFVRGAGHCDAAAIRATLPDTLEWMWRGYPIN